MIRFAIALVTMLVAADTASACNRCGLFGNRCRYVQRAHVYAQPVVAQPAYVPQQVTNLSIVNTYPQGSTVYGVGQLAAPYAVNPELAISAASRMADGAASALTAAITLGQESNAQVAEVAKLKLAVEHLQAAVGSAGQQSGSIQLRITQGAGGIKVEQMDGDEKPERITPPASASLLAAKCASCHGLEQTQPQAGLYYDAGHALDATAALRALDVIRGNDVPEGMRAVIEGLTPEDKAGLMEELLALWKREE